MKKFLIISIAYFSVFLNAKEQQIKQPQDGICPPTHPYQGPQPNPKCYKNLSDCPGKGTCIDLCQQQAIKNQENCINKCSQFDFSCHAQCNYELCNANNKCRCCKQHNGTWSNNECEFK